VVVAPTVAVSDGEGSDVVVAPAVAVSDGEGSNVMVALDVAVGSSVGAEVPVTIAEAESVDEGAGVPVELFAVAVSDGESGGVPEPLPVAVGVRGRDTVVVPAPVAECVGEKPPEGEALSPAGVAVVLREAVGARDELGEAEAIETVPVVEAETEGVVDAEFTWVLVKEGVPVGGVGTDDAETEPLPPREGEALSEARGVRERVGEIEKELVLHTVSVGRGPVGDSEGDSVGELDGVADAHWVGDTLGEPDGVPERGGEGVIDRVPLCVSEPLPQYDGEADVQ
jgi:hypothetical protein